MEWFTDPQIWMALLTLTALEMVLGIDNIIFIANLFALMQWYRCVRPLFVSQDFPQILLEALKEKLNLAIDERIKRLGDYCLKLPADLKSKSELPNRWPEIQDYLEGRQDFAGDTALRDDFLEHLNLAIKNSNKNYITAITGLAPEDTQPGTNWLQGIVDELTAGALELMP